MLTHSAYFSYFPNVAALDGGVDDEGPPQDPGAYFYHKNSVYGVDKRAGAVSWWIDLPGEAIAAYYLANAAVGEERYILSSTLCMRTTSTLCMRTGYSKIADSTLCMRTHTASRR